ncbi:MAG: TraR/DksA family transcriptional regulator [Chlamydiota bacterium]
MAKAKKAAAKAKVKVKRTAAPVKAKRAPAAAKPARRAKSPIPAEMIKKLKEMLITQKDRIMGDFMSLRETHLRSSQRESTGDLSGYSLHMADLGTDAFDREFALTVVSSEQDVLYRIDQALRRMEERTYGRCETCGSAIKLTRLKAVPWARLCLPCKEAEEAGGGGES